MLQKRHVTGLTFCHFLFLDIHQTHTFLRLHKEMWFRNLKAFGWNVLDLRYGGVQARCMSAKERIDDYLCGKINMIEELEAERLPGSIGGFKRYDGIVFA